MKQQRVAFLCLFSVAFFCTSFAQENILKINGVVRDQKDESKLSAVHVAVQQDGMPFRKTITADNGRFAFRLPLESYYVVEFTKRGYFSKKISVDARHIPPGDAAFGYEFGGWNVKLFREVKGLDVSVLDQPVARIVYDTVANVFSYDKDYIKLVEKQVEKLKKDYKKKLKEEELARKEAAKRKEAERIAAEKAEAKKQADLLAQQQRERKAREAAAKADAQRKAREEKKARQLEARKLAKEHKQRNAQISVKISGHSGGGRDSVSMPAAPDKQSVAFQQQLAKKYPQGITEERYKEGNISYIRRIVVEGPKGTEYLEAIHQWGGRFFFKNGEAITERLWILETETRFRKDGK
ncbi:MAG: hypothetical protein ACE5DN_01825 [Flavobacteriales bacterium]